MQWLNHVRKWLGPGTARELGSFPSIKMDPKVSAREKKKNGQADPSYSQLFLSSFEQNLRFYVSDGLWRGFRLQLLVQLVSHHNKSYPRCSSMSTSCAFCIKSDIDLRRGLQVPEQGGQYSGPILERTARKWITPAPLSPGYLLCLSKAESEAEPTE